MIEIFLNGSTFSLNSVISVNSGNRKNHWTMNWSVFKHNKHSYTLYSANWQLVQTKFYSSNSIAISVNRFDWHLEPNRSVRKWKHSLKWFLFLTCVLLAAGALLMSNNFSLKIQRKHLWKTALPCCQVHYLLSTCKLLLMPRVFSRQCKFMLLKCTTSRRVKLRNDMNINEPCLSIVNPKLLISQFPSWCL